MRSVSRFTLVVLVVLATSVGLWAQAGTGEVSGIIFDPLGAVVANAQITLTNDATGVARTTKPTAAGVYTFAAVSSGTYTLKVESPGFKPFKAAKLVVSTGAAVAQDVHLQVGGATESVTVEAGAQAVQTTESSISQLIGTQIWQASLLETRNQNSYINLVAGATPDVISTRGASVNGARGGTGNYMVEGMDNNDQGQGGRGQISPFDAGGAVTSISPDAIQEYRVITNSFAAEYGKAGGFVTDTVLKSGTNAFHGSLFEYNRVQALAANNFFSNRNEDLTNPGHHQKDRLVRNQFGGSIGGPIIKDKTFFFGQIEFHRARYQNPVNAVATTQQYLDWVNAGNLQKWAESDPNGICNNQNFLNGVFGVGVKVAAPCPGAFAQAATLGPIFNSMRKVSAFPVATGAACASVQCTAGQGDYTATTYKNAAGKSVPAVWFPVPLYANLNIEDPNYLNEYKIVGKFDHKLSSKDQLSYIWLLQNALSGGTVGGGQSTIGPPIIDNGRNIDTGITWTHTLSPTVLNSFKFSYLRHRSDFPSPDPALLTMPAIATWNDPVSVGLGLYAGLPQFFTDNQFQWQDHLSFVRGKHSFKAGAEYRRIRNGSSFHNDGAGTFYPWDINDLVTDLYFNELIAQAVGAGKDGAVGYTSASVDTTNSQVPIFYRGFRANEFAAYFQDDWRISQRFTLNLGLRWEYFGPPHNFQKNIDSNYYFGSPTPTLQAATLCTAAITTNCHTSNPFFPISNWSAMIQNGGFQVRNNEIWNKDTNNFGPRIGFAWDMLGNQKLVMRAGAGIMYDRLYNNVFENIRFNPPFFSDNQIGILINNVPVGAISTPGLYGYPFTQAARAQYNQAKYAPKPNPRHMDQNMLTSYYEQFHFGFQYEIAKGYVFEPEYVSTLGHKLTSYYDINNFDGRVACPAQFNSAGVLVPYAAGTPCANNGFANGFSTARVSNVIGADNFRTSGFSSNYHGLQLSLRKNYSNGLGFQANYTWSKVLDTISDTFNFRTTNVTDVQNILYDYGPADFNLKHRFVANVTYELPFMKGNRWLGGWAVNSIFYVQTGVPFSVYSSSTSASNDINKDGRSGDRRVTTGAAAMGTLVQHQFIAPGCTSTFGCGVGYFDPTQWTRYTCPATVNGGLWCDPPIGRNAMTAPGRWNDDLGISKRFKVNERSAVTFQANFFNVFNHPNFGTPSGNSSSVTFGQSTTATSPRITQLALRFDF